MYFRIAYIFIRGVDAFQAILLKKALFQRQAESNVESNAYSIFLNVVKMISGFYWPENAVDWLREC